MDASYSGGYKPGGRLFAVDGDFTTATPCGAPEIYNPFEGDSVPSAFPIILLDRTQDPPQFVSLAVGEGFNVQPFDANQSAIVIEQEFMVAEAYHVPLPLNTRYDTSWSVGWGNNYVGLGNCFLVAEGPLIPVGGGIVRFKRKFANLPPNRNEYESFSAYFPALQYPGDDGNRFGFTQIVNSRLFYEYFVYDNLNILGDIALFPAGHRINTDLLGDNARFLTFEQTRYFKGAPNAINNNNFLDPDTAISDGDGVDPTSATIPDLSTYLEWQFASEIVAEASSFNKWMGNIYVRRTRFVLAQ
ncbi:MAG TPA: hypothetical protein VF607_04110 [Verrucomicrobiae bacterium]